MRKPLWWLLLKIRIWTAFMCLRRKAVALFSKWTALFLLLPVLVFADPFPSWTVNEVPGNVVVEAVGFKVAYPIRFSIPCADGSAGYDVSDPVMIDVGRGWEKLTAETWCVCVYKDFSTGVCKKYKGPGCGR